MVSPERDQAESMPQARPGAAVGLIVIFILLTNVLEFWLPDYAATGISSLLVGIAGFGFKTIRQQYSFARWFSRILAYATLIAGVTWALSMIPGVK